MWDGKSSKTSRIHAGFPRNLPYSGVRVARLKPSRPANDHHEPVTADTPPENVTSFRGNLFHVNVAGYEVLP